MLSNENTIAMAYLAPAKIPVVRVAPSTVMSAGLSSITASKLWMLMVKDLEIVAGSFLTLTLQK